MAEDLVSFVEQMDRCWLERRFDDLSAYVAEDVVMVAPGGRMRMEGLRAAIDSYREFMGRCAVSRFETSGHVVTKRGAAAVVEYDWDMAWSDRGAEQAATGREVLVLSRRAEGWRVVWRMQLSG